MSLMGRVKNKELDSLMLLTESTSGSEHKSKYRKFYMSIKKTNNKPTTTKKRKPKLFCDGCQTLEQAAQTLWSFHLWRDFENLTGEGPELLAVAERGG